MKNFERLSSIKGETDKKAFQRYFEDLRLIPEDFDKKILDVGAGAAQFAKWAKERGMAKEIYSLEPKRERITEQEKSVAARAEAMPFADKSFDLVISNSAVPNVYIGQGDAETVKEKTVNSLREMLRVVKLGGEIRLGRVLIGKKYESQRILSKSIEKALESLEAEGDIQIEKIRTPSYNTYEYDKNHKPVKLLAEAYLIIIRKQKRS